MKQFCKRCGSKLDEQSGLCPLCDVAALTAARQQAPVTPPRQQAPVMPPLRQTAQPNPKQPNKQVRLAVIAVAAVLLVTAAVVLVILGIRHGWFGGGGDAKTDTKSQIRTSYVTFLKETVLSDTDGVYADKKPRADSEGLYAALIEDLDGDGTEEMAAAYMKKENNAYVETVAVYGYGNAGNSLTSDEKASADVTLLGSLKLDMTNRIVSPPQHFEHMLYAVATEAGTRLVYECVTQYELNYEYEAHVFCMENGKLIEEGNLYGTEQTFQEIVYCKHLPSSLKVTDDTFDFSSPMSDGALGDIQTNYHSNGETILYYCDCNATDGNVYIYDKLYPTIDEAAEAFFRACGIDKSTLVVFAHHDTGYTVKLDPPKEIRPLYSYDCLKDEESGSLTITFKDDTECKKLFEEQAQTPAAVTPEQIRGAYGAYLRDTLVPQYGVFDGSDVRKVDSGIYAAKLADFDADGADEMVVFYAEKSGESYYDKVAAFDVDGSLTVTPAGVLPISTEGITSMYEGYYMPIKQRVYSFTYNNAPYVLCETMRWFEGYSFEAHIFRMKDGKLIEDANVIRDESGSMGTEAVYSTNLPENFNIDDSDLDLDASRYATDLRDDFGDSASILYLYDVGDYSDEDGMPEYTYDTHYRNHNEAINGLLGSYGLTHKNWVVEYKEGDMQLSVPQNVSDIYSLISYGSLDDDYMDVKYTDSFKDVSDLQALLKTDDGESDTAAAVNLSAEDAVDIYLKDKNKWLNSSRDYLGYEPMYYEYGILDLNLDGVPELIVNICEGTMRASYNYFFTIDPQTKTVKEIDSEDVESGYDILILQEYPKLYRHKTTGQAMYFCCDYTHVSSGEYCEYYGPLTYDGNKIETGVPFFSYYHCDKEFSGGREINKYAIYEAVREEQELTKSQYEKKMKTFLADYEELSLKYEGISGSEFDEANNTDQRKMLLKSAKAFSYN